MRSVFFPFFPFSYYLEKCLATLATPQRVKAVKMYNVKEMSEKLLIFLSEARCHKDFKLYKYFSV